MAAHAISCIQCLNYSKCWQPNNPYAIYQFRRALNNWLEKFVADLVVELEGWLACKPCIWQYRYSTHQEEPMPLPVYSLYTTLLDENNLGEKIRSIRWWSTIEGLQCTQHKSPSLESSSESSLSFITSHGLIALAKSHLWKQTWHLCIVKHLMFLDNAR